MSVRPQGASRAKRKSIPRPQSLFKFLAKPRTLSYQNRKLIVEQALLLLEHNYVHLPMKRAMYSVEPVQRLKVLLRRLDSHADAPSELEFHRELLDTLHSLRDVHTRYSLPRPYRDRIARLPFRVEEYWVGKGKERQRKYVVTMVDGAFATFECGVEVVYWNGVPMEQAVWSHAQRFPGSNDAARHARGLLTLTNRPLAMSPPPEEEWVVVSYLTAEGEPAERQFSWEVVSAPSDSLPASPPGGQATELDVEVRMVNRAYLEQAKRIASRAKKSRTKGLEGRKAKIFEEIIEGRPEVTPSGTFAYVRIWDFWFKDTKAFIEEFIRLITTLPQNGLIIDVRNNGGGHMRNAECILQTLTPRVIEPEPLQFLNTPLNLQICRSRNRPPDAPDLKPWIKPIQEGLQTGAVYSAGFPQLSGPGAYNEIGQKYFGPVVLITSALSYSATDIFAAGFQDHEIGPIIGTHSRTGGGGANVWEHERFEGYGLAGRPYKRLPQGAGLKVAIRRSLRVGKKAGAVLEDFGVEPEVRYWMSLEDVLNQNEELIARAGAVLAAQRPLRALRVTVKATSPTEATVVAYAKAMDRLDAYLDDRPASSVDVAGGEATFVVGKPSVRPSVLEIRGYHRTRLVARYRTCL